MTIEASEPKPAAILRPRGEALAAAALAAAPVLVVVAAAVVRTVLLSTQPGGLYPDEGAEALDAHRLLHQAGFHPLFFTSDAGREVLYGYTVAAAFSILGESAVVLRGVSAAFGVAGVIAIYLALRRFGRGAAIAGMAWAAGSLWLIAVARDGMRNITVPLFAALAIWALLRWADAPRRATALVAGIAIGAGLWTYQPLKLTPLLVALWLGWIWWQDRPRFQVMVRQAGWIAAAYLLVALPLIYVAITDPGGYFGRAVGVSALNPANGQISFVEHTIRTLGMFAITGDPNQRHDVASLPLLGWPLFLLALIGAWRAWRRRSDAGHALLLLGVPVFLIPPLLGIDGGVPHFLRSLGLAPFLAGLIGLGAVDVYDHARSWTRRDRAGRATAAALGVMLVALGAGSVAAYFSRPVSDRYEAYSYNVVSLALAAGRDSAVVADGYSEMDVRFLDAAELPAIYAPGARIDRPGRYTQVVALQRQDLVDALGPDLAQRAVVVSRDPSGQPAVWAVRALGGTLPSVP